MAYRITETQINKDFNTLKKLAKKQFTENKLELSLKTIEMASNLMYSFSLVYVDDELEELLSSISKALFKDGTWAFSNTQNNRIVFYDFFSLDNRGLTQQYLRALMNLKYEILYITHDSNDKKRGADIIRELSEYEKSRVYYIKSRDYAQACIELYNAIGEFNPGKAVMQTSPSDMIGLTTFSFLEGKVKRFFINITAHAFWLGKNSADFFIEFSSYGYSTSMEYRGIEKGRIFILPYYPIQNHLVEFEGFPFNPSGKKIIFSGGSLYKIYGSSIFLDTVKHILKNHEDVLFLYAGNGDAGPLCDYLEKNQINNRFYHISERKDITQIFKRCYFYLGTYPVGGGLMAQYAVANKKIPIVYNDKDSPIGFVEVLFLGIKNIRFTYTDMESYYEEIDRLISDPNYLAHREAELDGLLIDEKEFCTELENCLEGRNTKFVPERIAIDHDGLVKKYLDIENNGSKKYYELFTKRNYLEFLLIHPELFMRGLFSKLKTRLGKFHRGRHY